MLAMSYFFLKYENLKYEKLDADMHSLGLW